MKNIFSWSVLLSMFTIFFYWFGYWYIQGYTSYFGYDIEFYDIPIQYILISGFLKSPTETIIFVVILIILSLLSQFTRNQKKYFFHRFSELFVYTCFFVYLGIEKTISKIFNYTHTNAKKIVYSERVISRIIKVAFILIFLPLSLFIIIILAIPFAFILIVIELFRAVVIFMYAVERCRIKINNKILKKKIIKELKIHTESVEKDVKSDKNHTFDVLYSFHSVVLVALLFSLLFILKLTIDINEKGINDARIIYNCSLGNNESKCSNKFNIIEFDNTNDNKNELEEVWYVTNVCVEQKCIVFSQNGKNKLVDVTDKNITIQ